MKIAQIANIAEPVPPKKYGGTERVVYALTEELVRRGHEVTLFASGDSITAGKLVSVYSSSLRKARIADPYGLNPLALHHIGIAYQKQHEFDIIHDHNWLISMPTANVVQTPVVMTMHGALDVINKHLFVDFKNIHYVTVSKAQQEPLNQSISAEVVHNGLPMQSYPFSKEAENYLLFVGRISMQKGLHHAIQIAKYLRLPLLIAAKLDKEEKSYFKKYIEPHLSSDIRWIGEVDEEERNRLMSRALCLLHPVTWREPFGLTVIEAMACGCPVVAFNRGAVPELIHDGKTGYIVEDVEEMITAVKNIKKIQRQDCREYALEKFSVTRMADKYEALYQRIVEKNFKKTNGKHHGNGLHAKRVLQLKNIS